MMPLFESEASPHGRRRVFIRSQLPFALGALFIAEVALVVRPESLSTWPMLVGFALAVVATAAAIAIPWEKHRPVWLLTIAGADLVAVALFHAELMLIVPAVTILAMFPILWLGYGFPWYGIVVATGGAAFITAFPFAYKGTWPTTVVEFATVIAFPVLIVGVAVLVFFAARHLRRTQHGLRAALEDLRAASANSARTDAALLSFARRTDVGLVLLNESGDTIFANDAAYTFADLAGVEVGAVDGHHIYAPDQVTPLPSEQQPLVRILAGETVVDELVWFGSPQQQRAFLTCGNGVTLPDGAPAGIFLVMQDVTDTLLAARERENALVTLTHELRTPLTSIIGYLELIDVDELPDQARKIAVVSRNAEHLLNLTTALLDDLKDKPVQPTELVLVQRLVDHAVEATMATFPALKDRDLRVQIAPDCIIRVEQDTITRALRNLLGNAIKFSDPGGQITIDCAQTPSTVVLHISNTGQPLSPADLARIFDRFGRGSNARQQAAPGVGLGLPISRDIVTHHGGTLEASQEGNRTVFAMTFPRP